MSSMGSILYDPTGQITCYSTGQIISYRHDLNGNLTNDGVRAYSWDEADRLIEVRDLQTSDVLVQNRYDGLSRRRERIQLEDGILVTNRYVYDGWLVVAVLDGDNEVLEQYVYGVDLSGTREDAGGIGGILQAVGDEVAYYHYDGNGNVISATDSNAVVMTRLEYDPFGRVLVADGSYTPRYQFSSKEYDAATGLNYYGYRFYSPALGRWLSRDPLGDYGFFAQYTQGMSKRERRVLNDESSRHPYAFVYNDPVAQFDALGLVSFDDTDCANADPTSDTAVCDVHKGVVLEKAGLKWDAECVCKCAGSSDWDNQVRGCLACAQSAGVPTTEAHQKCYEIADKKYGFLGSGLPARLDIGTRCCKCIKGL